MIAFSGAGGRELTLCRATSCKPDMDCEFRRKEREGNQGVTKLILGERGDLKEDWERRCDIRIAFKAHISND